MSHKRSGSMTQEEFRLLRHQLGLSAEACGRLLGCKEQTIRNIEHGKKPPGHQTALLLRLASYPHVRALMEQLYVQEILTHKSEESVKISLPDE